MEKARLRPSKREIHAVNYERETDGPVECFYCGCDVVGVSRGKRVRESKVIQISPFFRLSPNAQSSGIGHTEQCPHNVRNILTKYVAQSREIKSIDSRAAALLAWKGNRVRFRLHILMEAFRWLRRNRYRGSLAPEQREQIDPARGNRYVRTEHVLIPYMKTAKAIHSLVAAVQDHPELENFIEVVYGPNEIPVVNTFLIFISTATWRAN
jgi:hypothetical protein